MDPNQPSSNTEQPAPQNGAVASVRPASDSLVPSRMSTKGPAGGFDATPIPSAPPGFTLKFTFHRAENLPLGDLATFSSDPYIKAILQVALPTRHPKLDPPITFRTPTIRRETNPIWDSQWIVANVPASGFRLKCRIYDEDTADHDDRLGNVQIDVPELTESWPGLKEQVFRIRKRMGSQRAYLLRAIVAAVSRNTSVNGLLYVSIENLGRTPGEDGGQMYTLGPNYWRKHFSPMLGLLITGTKDEIPGVNGKRSVSRYNFQAIQMQLQGPMPAPLYHRYVEFRSFVSPMFTAKSLRGRLLNHALHHQHARIYTYDRFTVYGEFPEPSDRLTKRFLEFVHHGQGGRIFTYVLTLDSQWRFTETGKEFGIDLLSKHTLHSDVSIYIAYSGEFFVRPIHHHSSSHRRHRSKSPSTTTDTHTQQSDENDHEPTPLSYSRHDSLFENGEASPSTDPADYELFIDNDSGTYRPNAQLLPLLQEFLSKNLPGLKITTLDCQKDAKRMSELKEKQREAKRASGRHIAFLQRSRSSLSLSSISSSDEEELNNRISMPDAPTSRESTFAKLKDPKARYKRWLASDHGHNHIQQDRPSTAA
ncbi:hypothetical protein FQN57_004589 [Myotisia sp. PD_48]|nr:hypothetical protein FQN57_004589 [Myotisia sp. PD_48]